ncbi:MAG: ECF transporter S component [Eubacteriales bacterium]
MNTNKLVRTALLLALALLFQIGFLQIAQPLVGPLVNMTLILATLIVGAASGIFIGIITPVVAFAMGIIGIAPLIPLIIIGNTLWVVIFYIFNDMIKVKGNKWMGIIAGAFVKFSFLAISVRTVLTIFMPKVPPAVIATFTLPQLYTAFLGGTIALLIYPLLKKGIK